MKPCFYCLEPILEGEPIREINRGAEYAHYECMIRMVAGSVGHQLKACSCFGGTEDDPKGATRREAARAAARLFCAPPGEGHA